MKRFMVSLAFLLAAVSSAEPAAAEPATGGEGELAPDFTLENVLDFAPDFFSVQDYRGSVVVIFFFAYW